MFVIGNPAEKLGYKHGGGGITSEHIQDMMSLIYNLGNTSSHSFDSSHPTELSDDEIQNYDNHIKTIGGNSKLLIFSMALQFCEILQWMNNYIKTHPDKEENRKKWKKLDGIDNTPEAKDDSIGIVEVHNGIYHIGEKYLLNGKTIEQRGWLGKKVRVLEKDKNINKSPYAAQYPFFAFRIEPVE